MNIYYVYAYLRKKSSAYGEAGSPYYIGKGTGNRLFVNHLDCGGRKPKDSRFVIKIFENLTENESFRLEAGLIAIFGRINLGTGCLRNLTNGGTGSSGRVLTEESRRKMSIGQKARFKMEEPWNKGRACPEEQKQIQRQKMLGRQAWNKGKTWSEETRNKMSDSHKGIKLSEEHKRSISRAHKGKTNSGQFKKGQIPWNASIKNYPTTCS